MTWLMIFVVLLTVSLTARFLSALSRNQTGKMMVAWSELMLFIGIIGIVTKQDGESRPLSLRS